MFSAGCSGVMSPEGFQPFHTNQRLSVRKCFPGCVPFTAFGFVDIVLLRQQKSKMACCLVFSRTNVHGLSTYHKFFTIAENGLTAEQRESTEPSPIRCFPESAAIPGGRLLIRLFLPVVAPAGKLVAHGDGPIVIEHQPQHILFRLLSHLPLELHTGNHQIQYPEQ